MQHREALIIFLILSVLQDNQELFPKPKHTSLQHHLCVLNLPKTTHNVFLKIPSTSEAMPAMRLFY